MNRKIIQKLINELNNEKPRLDYVIGVLDMFLESLPEEPLDKQIDKALGSITPSLTVPGTIEDEGSLLDKEARARLAGIKLTYDN
jgi:hypothetical protein